MPDDEPPPNLRPQTVHELDQLGGILSDVAPLVAGFYRALIAQGLPPEVAGQQCQAVVTALLTAAWSKREDWRG